MPQHAVGEAVRVLNAEFGTSMRTDTGGDLKLSGVRRGRPLKVTVRRQNLGTVSSATLTADGFRAAWVWLQDGTNQRSSRNGRTWRGSPAKHTWSRPIEQAQPAITDAFNRAFDRATQ